MSGTHKREEGAETSGDHAKSVLSRRGLLGAIGASSAAALAGCTAGSDGDGSGDGNALRVSIILDPGSPLNTYISMNARWDWLNDLVFDRLFLPSPQVEEPVPGLATKATQVDATTWEATIRDGVEWHDGEPFSAADVAFSYNYYREGPHSRHAHHVKQVPDIESIEVVDDKTVRFKTAYPTPTLRKVTMADLPVFAKHIWKDVEKPRKYQELPVGTGPYELVEYKEGERLRFEATGDYFLGETQVDEIVVPIIQDPSVTFTALKSGEIDSTVRPVPPETLQQFRQDDALEVVEATQLRGVEIRQNFTKQPFRTHEFRWALSRAIDIERVVDVVMLGEAIPGTEGFPHPRSPWTAPDIGWQQQPEKARQKFTELGFEDRDGDGVRESEDGEPLSFSLTAPSNEPQYIRAAELVAGQLEGFGIDITVETADPGTIRSYYGSFDYDMYISFTNLHLAADPDQFVMNHRGGPNLLWNIDPSQGLLGNYDVKPEDLAYPEFEKLQKAYFEAETLEKQVEALHEMHRLHNRQPVAIPLWYPYSHQVYRTDAHDAYAESPGFGINHKYSFLDPSARGGTVTKEFN